MVVYLNCCRALQGSSKATVPSLINVFAHAKVNHIQYVFCIVIELHLNVLTCLHPSAYFLINIVKVLYTLMQSLGSISAYFCMAFNDILCECESLSIFIVIYD